MNNLTESENNLQVGSHDELSGEFVDNFTESKPECILLVDDDKELSEGLCIDLRANGYEVLVADNGCEGLEILQEHGSDIHLILSDERMPVMSGYEFCRKVKSNPAWWAIPLVFLTARIGEEHFLEGYRVGAGDYIQKPYNLSKMIAIVKKRIADYRVLLAYRADELERERLTTIEQMARGVIHDLTGVLTELGFGQVVKDFLDLIHQEVSQNLSAEAPRATVLEAVDKIHEHCGELKQAIDLGISLLEGLQSLCKGHGEERTLQMLGEIVKTPLGLLQHRMAMQGIDLKCDLAPVLVECRKRDMVQVALNLIRNSMHAMESSAEKVLSIRTWEDDANVFLRVTDTGCGIPPENQEKIFAWGFTTKRTGKGIGMPTIKRIVEAHDGSVTLESEVGRGTAITVAFPVYGENE